MGGPNGTFEPQLGQADALGETGWSQSWQPISFLVRPMRSSTQKDGLGHRRTRRWRKGCLPRPIDFVDKIASQLPLPTHPPTLQADGACWGCPYSSEPGPLDPDRG